MSPEQAKATRLNTDYPLDKVVIMRSGSVTIPSFDYNDITIPHGLDFAPLVLAIYSTSPSFGISYEYNSGAIQTNPAIPSPFLYQTSSSSDATNVTLRHTSFSTSSVTLYYRLYAFEPSDSSSEVQHTEGIADNFVLNTDYNYSKLYMSGVTGYSNVSGSTVTVAHNLGYKPQLLAWAEIQGSMITDMNYADVTAGSANSTVEVTATQVIFRRSDFTFSNERFHYRIYLDD